EISVEEPGQIVASPETAAEGSGRTETVVEPAAEPQPATVTVTEYVPAAAAVTPGIVGFWSEDAKPFGPVQEYVAPATVEAVSCSVPPTHTGPLLPAVGAAGIALTVVEAFAELFAADGSFVLAATDAVFVAVPGAVGAVIATVIAGAAPGESDGRVHVTVAVPLQVQPPPEADTSVAPAGSASVTVSVVAVD